MIIVLLLFEEHVNVQVCDSIAQLHHVKFFDMRDPPMVLVRVVLE